MKWFKGLSVLVVTALALCVSVTPALAHDVPDMTRTGTISATMDYDGVPVAGGTVTLYRVGDVVEDNGNYDFALTAECAASEVSLDDLQSAEAAEALLDWALEQGLAGVTVEVGDDGVATFEGVELGLYVLAQSEPAEGYYAIDPFLICVPMNEEGTYVYDVDASPKLELEKKPTPPDEDIPVTGEAAQPTTELFVAGAVLCAAAMGTWLWRRARTPKGLSE